MGAKLASGTPRMGNTTYEGVSTQSVRAESPAPHSPGQRPGYFVFLKNNAPCKGNTLIIKLLPLQGVRLVCTF